MRRPRTTTPDFDESVKLGQEMLEWVQINRPVHLSCWYLGVKDFVYEKWKLLIIKQEFRPYYEKALHLVSLNYILKESSVEPNVKNRFLRVYFRDLRDEENDQKRFEATVGQTLTDKAPNDEKIEETQELMKKDYEIQNLNSQIEELKKQIGNKS